MTRRVAAALSIWTATATLGFLFAFGGQVHNCLGPLDVTPAQCRAALGLPPETDLDRFMAGPGPLVVALAAGWVVIPIVGRWRTRQRGDL